MFCINNIRSEFPVTLSVYLHVHTLFAKCKAVSSLAEIAF